MPNETAAMAASPPITKPLRRICFITEPFIEILDAAFSHGFRRTHQLIMIMSTITNCLATNHFTIAIAFALTAWKELQA
jgi:hypothetical protein